MKYFPRARWIALTSVVAISFVSGAWLTLAKPSVEGNVYQQARLFENVVGAIHNHYIDSMGEGDLYQRAANALVTSLNDPYAELLVRESYREYQRQMTGTQLRTGVQRPAESGWGVSASTLRRSAASSVTLNPEYEEESPSRITLIGPSTTA